MEAGSALCLLSVNGPSPLTAVNRRTNIVDRNQQPEPEPQSACPPPRPPAGTRATAGSSEPDDPRPAQLIYREARRAGLTDAEGQEVLRKLAAYVAERVANGTLNPGDCGKAWLLRLTRWRIIDTLRMRRTTSEREFAA